jgi:hypothetical protein
LLIVFVSLLAALGAATVLRGHEIRGLLVLLVANATVGLGAAASTRWGWLAFSTAMTGLCLVGIAMVRNESAPAEPDEERDPDYCWTHKKLEPEEER